MNVSTGLGDIRTEDGMFVMEMVLEDVQMTRAGLFWWVCGAGSFEDGKEEDGEQSGAEVVRLEASGQKESKIKLVRT